MFDPIIKQYTMYKFSSKGSVLLFKTIKNLIKKGSVKNWVSDALNIMSKDFKINIQSTNHIWSDVDNLVDLKSAKKIIKKLDK